MMRKRDQDFRRSLPYPDSRLGLDDIGPYLGKGGDLTRATAENWRYHLYHALRMTHYALCMAYTNQHPDARDKAVRVFIRQCWFVLAVLSLQAASDKLAKLLRDRLQITRWKRMGGKPRGVTDQNTNLATVACHLRAAGRTSSADLSLRRFMCMPEADEVYDLANDIKHGETLAWKGLEPIPVVEVDKPDSFAPTRGDVGRMFTIEDEETAPNGKTARTTLRYGQKDPCDLDAEVRKVARVYRAFVPIVEALVKEYTQNANLESSSG